jgi:hypothetical protein
MKLCGIGGNYIVTNSARRATLILILTVLGILLLVFVAYLLYRFVLPRWESVAFYVYLFVSLVSLLVFPVVFIVVWKRETRHRRSGREMLLDSFVHVSQASNRIAKLRGYLSVALNTLEDALVWPTILVTVVRHHFTYQRMKNMPNQMKEFRLRDFNNQMTMRFPDIYRSFLTLALILLLYMLSITGVTEAGYDRILVIILGAAL